MEKIKLLNTYVNHITSKQVLDLIKHSILTETKTYIVEVNVDVIVKIENDGYLKQIVDEADLVLVDGMPLVWISKFYGKQVPEKISGSDLSLSVCELSANNNFSIFLLGGEEGVGEKAKKLMERNYPGVNIVGTYAPPIGFEKDETELKKTIDIISDCKPDIVIVCFGCPKQEKWIYENYKKIDSKVFLCAGGTINFLAGDVKRAPKWISSIGFEWLFRFLMEPRRLFKRYFIDDMKILKLIFKYKNTKAE